jgi:hypothetical protein
VLNGKLMPLDWLRNINFFGSSRSVILESDCFNYESLIKSVL